MKIMQLRRGDNLSTLQSCRQKVGMPIKKVRKLMSIDKGVYADPGGGYNQNIFSSLKGEVQ